ncbi:MAG: amidohydrolase [Armatimonadia bacterium]|nr:amidohydrolase [Armatimonadia bacterium]
MHPQDRIRAAVRAHADQLTDLARRIHANPELGLQERQACAWHSELLRGWGFEVTTPFAGLDTAYRATAGEGAPTFCFMAEYDALPGIGHGCGHNLIGAAAVGAGRALLDVLREEGAPGTVVVMGTPAEEGHGGKVKMLAQDALAGIDAVILAHPRWQTMPDTGCNAIARFRISFEGRAAHAAAAPEQGRNALDAVMLAFQGVNAWRQYLLEDCRVHGYVDDGGSMANTIPERASCILYLRAGDEATLEAMIARLRMIAEGASLMTATTAHIEPWGERYAARIPNAPLNDAWLEATERAGLSPVMPEKPNRASSDFGDVSQRLPAAHVYFGIADEPTPVHSPEFCAAAGSDLGIERMLLAAESLAAAGYRYLTDPDFRDRAEADYQAAIAARRESADTADLWS